VNSLPRDLFPTLIILRLRTTAHCPNPHRLSCVRQPACPRSASAEVGAEFGRQRVLFDGVRFLYEE
jgi:hypothetical protein